MATSSSAPDFASAAEVRRAMIRAPWTPLALRVALLIFDFQGLRRGRCELGTHRLACHVYAVELASPAFLDLDARARATRMGRMKRSIKRALAELGDVLDVERRGDGKTSHRHIRTDIVLSRWGDAATTVGGDEPVTPSPSGGGDGVVTPSAGGEVTGPSPGGWRARHPRGDAAVTPHREDLLEDLLEDPPPNPPHPPPAFEPSPRTLAVIEASPAEECHGLPDWRPHLERDPADVEVASRNWARAFEIRLGAPLAPNERPKLDEVAVYLWSVADTSGRPWCVVARRALDALFADRRLPVVRHPGGWAKSHVATIADLITGDAPIPDTLDLDAMRDREARSRRTGRDAYQRARMTPDLLEGPELGDEDIPMDPPRRVIPYGPGGAEQAPRKVVPYGLGSNPGEPSAPALAAWQAAIRSADGTPPPLTAADVELHAEVAGLAREHAGARPVEDVLEDWATRWYRWADAPTARSWCTWARATAAGKEPRSRRGFVEAGTDFTEWGDADIHPVRAS